MSKQKSVQPNTTNTTNTPNTTNTEKQFENFAKQMAQMKTDDGQPDINKMIDSVTTMFVGNNTELKENITKMTKGLMNNINIDEFTGLNEKEVLNSKVEIPQIPQIGLGQSIKNESVKNEMYEVLDPSTNVPELNPVVKDLVIPLGVSLEELYKGTTKKIKIKCKRIQKDPKGQLKLGLTDKSFNLDIKKGTYDEQRIRLNKQGDEEFGKETGDILIVLKQNGHNMYEREGETLFVTKKISLFESCASALGIINLTLQTLDNRVLVLDSNGIPLHLNDGLRKINGEGMPKFTNPNEKGDLYIRFHLVLPDKFDLQFVNSIKNVFPPVNTDIVYNDNSKNGIDIKHLKNVKKCLLDEVTEEDLEKLNEYETGSDSDSESDSESRSESNLD